MASISQVMTDTTILKSRAAMNPFTDEKAYFRHALKVIGDFAVALGAEVEPVHPRERSGEGSGEGSGERTGGERRAEL